MIRITPEELERRLSRMKRQESALGGFRAVLIGFLAFLMIYNLATRHALLALWDAGLVAFNFWFPRWIGRRVERRKAEVRVLIAEIERVELWRIASEINEKFIRGEYDDE